MIFGQHHHVTRRDLPTADPDHFNRGNDPAYPQAVEAVYRQYYRLPTSEFLAGWSCVYGTTADGYPVISRDMQVSNLYHALGMNGHGMTIHAGIARCIAALMLEGKTSVDVSDVMPWPATLDFSVLDAGRFACGALLDLNEVEQAPAVHYTRAEARSAYPRHERT
jgi:sarcosine oxidase subunit beta